MTQFWPVARYLAWWVFVGALVTVLFGVQAIVTHGFIGLGFQRNALLAIHDALLPGLLAIVAPLLVDLVGRATVALVRRLQASLEGAIAIGLVSGLLVVVMAAGASGGLWVKADHFTWNQPHTRTVVQGVLVLLYAFSLPIMARLETPADTRRVRLQRRFAGFLPILICLVALVPMGLRERLFSVDAPLMFVTLALSVVAFELGVRRGLRVWVFAQVGLGLACLAAIGLIPVFPLPTGLAASKRHNVVLIAIDTLRYDSMDLDPPGGDRDRTPNLRAFADRATIFTRGMSSSSWTFPSFASVFTGHYPRQHGANSFEAVLGQESTTLAEYLREAGYATTGVVSHIFVDAEHGMAQGFDAVDESCVLGHDAVTGEDVTDLAIAQLDAVGDGPFFLWVHYFDTHYEYVDHADVDWANWYKGELTHPELGLSAGMEEVRLMLPRLGPRDMDYIRDLYDEETRYTDRHLGRLIRAVEKVDPDAIIALVTDHGEEFAERGWLGHTVTLHDELVHVPLIVRGPGQRQRREVNTTVETRALFGTLLELVGIDLPAHAPSLVAHMEGKPVKPVMALSEVHIPDGPGTTGKLVTKTAVRTDDWALIRDHRRGRDRLFNLRSDPGELVDVYEQNADAVAALTARIDEHAGSIQAKRQQLELSSDTKEQLRSLGYMH